MSEYGEGDYCPVHEFAWRKARKQHTCDACGEAITPGRTYHRTFLICDGTAFVTVRCERCQAIYDHLAARIRGEGDLEQYCNETLDCGHEYEERWGEPPPEWLAALAFWLPGDPLPENKKAVGR
jgi:hypothetical protein